MWKLVFFVTAFLWSFAHPCTTPLGATSVCVSLYECPELSKAFEQRPLPSYIVSFLRQSQCGFEGYVPRVCCGPIPSQSSQPQATSTQRPSQSSINFDGQVDPVSREDSSPAARNQCGIDTNGDRIYGGQFTDLDEFPWLGLVGYRKPSGVLTYQCGGALLNRRYVLTAAHCIIGAIEKEVGIIATVRLGEYDTQNAIDCVDNVCAAAPQEIPVQGAYPHRGYTDRNKNKRDDIGLIRLARRVTYSYYVQPICLVGNNERLAAGNDVYVAGWGKTLNGKNSPIKLKLGLPIFNKNECLTKYRTLGADLTDNQICAGGVFAEDACRGDSGGPLMKRRPEGVWDIVGIVSFGYGCGRDGWPGVYTSVANYLDWIQETMRSSNV